MNHTTFRFRPLLGVLAALAIPVAGCGTTTANGPAATTGPSTDHDHVHAGARPHQGRYDVRSQGELPAGLELIAQGKQSGIGRVTDGYPGRQA